MAERISDSSQVTANTVNIPDGSVDCGISALGWCRGSTCQKYARLRTFIIILAIAGTFQGACESYFRVSAKQAALEYNLNPLIVDWLLVASGLMQAVFALAFAHWAHKLHPISWIGGSLMIQSAICVTTMIPLILNFSNKIAVHQPKSDYLCTESTSSMASSEQNKIVILVMLFILQFGLGLGALAFYIIGIVYVDDNSQSIDSPAAIATVLGAKIGGLQIGAFLIVGVGMINIGWWLGWIVLAPLIFVSGFLLSLFPKRLPKTVIHHAAQQIIEESRLQRFGSQFSTYIDDTDFGPSFKRIFNNKLLMFNLMSIMFIQAATFNYAYQEESYMQSRFFLPFSEEDGLMQEWQAHFMSYFFKPPVASVALLVGGLVISKLQLSGRKITGINIVLGIHLALIYVAFVFIKCDVGSIVGVNGAKLQQPLCSSQCTHLCMSNTFQPVCPENTTMTYFSPCYAGCKTKVSINSVVLYEDCSCGYGDSQASWQKIRATDGSCSAAKCGKMLIVFQVLSLMAAGLLGTTIIGKVIISLRSVLPQDKPLALAMEVMLIGLFAFVPVHLSYDVVTRSTCTLWNSNYTKCLLRETPKHGNILNILTAVLILVGIFFDILVFIYVEGLNLYNCKVTDNNYTPSLYAPLPPDDTPVTTQSPAQKTPDNSPNLNEPHAGVQLLRPAPKPVINVFRNPSSLTNSSAGGSSLESGTNGVTYAKVVFPPDRRKRKDGHASPKRMAVRADVPLHYLTAEDVRTRAQQLKSFNAGAIQPEGVDTVDPAKVTKENTIKPLPIATNLDDKRPKSPETEF